MKKMIFIIPIIILLIFIYITVVKNNHIKLDYHFNYEIIDIKKADPKNDGNTHMKLYYKNRLVKVYSIYYSYNNTYDINIYKLDNYYVLIIKGDKVYISFFNNDGMHIDTVFNKYSNIIITDAIRANIDNITYKYYVKDDVFYEEIDNIVYVNN